MPSHQHRDGRSTTACLMGLLPLYTDWLNWCVWVTSPLLLSPSSVTLPPLLMARSPFPPQFLIPALPPAFSSSFAPLLAALLPLLLIIPTHLFSPPSILAPLLSRPRRRCRGLAEIYATLRVGARDKTLAVIVGRAVNESHSSLRPITPPHHSVSQELYLHSRRCSLDHLAEASRRDGGDRTLANSEITNTQVRNASASSSSIPLGH